MEKVTLNIPTLWADHHVLAVRQALGQVKGVAEVTASALYQDVLIQYDPAAVTPEALADALAQAGYPVAAAPVSAHPPAAHRRLIRLVPVPGTDHGHRQPRPGNVRRFPQVLGNRAHLS